MAEHVLGPRLCVALNSMLQPAGGNAFDSPNVSYLPLSPISCDADAFVSVSQTVNAMLACNICFSLAAAVWNMSCLRDEHITLPMLMKKTAIEASQAIRLLLFVLTVV